MRRFLLTVGYCGTSLRGVQKQLDEGVNGKACSVHGLLEKALVHLRPANPPELYISSRTDAGVHALCNTLHVDLERLPSQPPYEPEYITIGVNRYFQKTKADIRVHRTVHVPPTFHARFNATGRTYLYRLAVIRPEADLSQCQSLSFDSLIPIGELHRCYLVKSPFDVEKVKEACEILQGSHDFATFAGKTGSGVDTKRTINQITVTEGRPLLDPAFEPLYSNLQFWDITVNSRSFLYRQVRKTVGVLVALGQERISFDDLHRMLSIPSRDSWPSKAITAPPAGLYLVNVHYPLEAFCFPYPDFSAVDSWEEDKKL